MAPPAGHVNPRNSRWGLGVVVAGVLLVGAPWLQPGWFAVYDLLLLPDMPFSDAALGVDAAQPRNVPSDALVAGLAALPFPQLTYRALLLGILVVAGLGARWCLRDTWWPGGAVAGLLYVWNPFVFERLAIGQWALLVGYAAVPWVVASISRDPRHARVGAVALVLGCLGGVSAALLLAVVVVVVLAVDRADFRAWVRWLSLWLLASAPWLLLALARGDAYSDPNGFSAFAPRADGPLTTLGSLVTLGGFWSSRSDVPGRDQLVGALLVLLLVVVAIWGAVRYSSAGDDDPDRVPVRSALWVGGAGLLLAFLSSLPAVRDSLASLDIPGLGVLRDGQKWVGLWALPLSLGLGCIVLAVARRGALAGRVAAVLGLVAPIALTPALAWGLSGRVVPVEPPTSDWNAALTEVRSDPGPILSLPWAGYRTTTWSNTTVLDPLTKIAPVPVIWNDGIEVGSVRVAGESVVAAEVTAALRSGQSPVEVARAAGARWIWLDASGFALVSDESLRGAEEVVSNGTVRLYRVDPVGWYPGPVVGRWVAWLGLAVWAGALLWAVASPHRATTQDRAVGPFR